MTKRRTNTTAVTFVAAALCATIAAGALVAVLGPSPAPQPDAAPVAGIASVPPPAPPGPSVWMSALDATPARGFAAPDFRDPPMQVPLASMVVAQPADLGVSAQVAPLEPAPEPVARAPATVAAPVAPTVTVSVTAPDPQAETVIAALDGSLDRPALADPAPLDPAQALLALAPERSLLPAARAERVTLAATAEPATTQIAATQIPQDPVALAAAQPEAEPPATLPSSRLPRPRPEGVARLDTRERSILASLAATFSTSAPETAPQRVSAEASAPRPTPAVIEPTPQADTRALASARCDSARAIPRRSGRAPTGSSVTQALHDQSGRARDTALVEQIVAGNVPDFLRRLVPVTFQGTDARNRPVTITICVTPDYLAVGDDRDFTRVPLGLPAAMQVAQAFDMVLPTTRMVDAIHAQAQLQLSPSPMTPGSQMASTAYFERHNATIEGQRQASGARLGQLVAGHKKDLVLSNRLVSAPGRVAIYGWHYRNGRAIQPLSTVHGAQYADYSHGIRLVSRQAFVNGRAVDLRDILGDNQLAGIVSSEGALRSTSLLAAL